MLVLEAYKPFEVQELQLSKWQKRPLKNNFFEQDKKICSCSVQQERPIEYEFVLFKIVVLILRGDK